MTEDRKTSEGVKEIAGELVSKIQKQNWKNGGALVVDVPEAEAMVVEALTRHGEAVRAEALEEAANICAEIERKQEADHGAANTGGAAEAEAAIRARKGAA